MNNGRRNNFGSCSSALGVLGTAHAASCQLCHDSSHFASRCPMLSQFACPHVPNSLHTAFAGLQIAGQLQTPAPGPTYTTHSLHDPSWYPDTGASTHMIGNLSLLQQCLPYNGHDTVHLGNGDQMPISYTSNMSLFIGSN
ncbi:PREDICTED: Retrovirus-related Pol poly from transposon TNT [Prunus dulcis]|uniref:PREDICTED: Retrovirus-related Pol poly from transposon TNT n=1 Tax=Prunus dulcis TaxID=3755 RepID=A0A5E4FMX5_PRUDU|nr:PREDICTED: Retrovirus-related Pol poly from transposon TNT [Prunus dulcis]